MIINRFDMTDNMHFHFYHYDDPLYRRSMSFACCELAIATKHLGRKIAKVIVPPINKLLKLTPSQVQAHVQ